MTPLTLLTGMSILMRRPSPVTHLDPADRDVDVDEATLPWAVDGDPGEGRDALVTGEGLIKVSSGSKGERSYGGVTRFRLNVGARLDWGETALINSSLMLTPSLSLHRS